MAFPVDGPDGSGRAEAGPVCPSTDDDKEMDRRPLPKLVGRGEQLSVVTDVLNGAVKGHGTMLLVDGEIGIGKTRLLTEAEKVARQLSMRVLWARCIGGATPLMPFLNALENVSHSADAAGATIEEVFFVHTDGRLIIHDTQRQRPDLGDEELRALLEEIKKTAKAGLKGLFLGDRRIIVELGAVTALAAVVRGEETPKMRQQMKYLIATLEDKYGETLLEWTGSLADLKGLRESLRALLLGDYGKPEALKFDFEVSSPTVVQDLESFLVKSSRQMPAVLLFDDIHWMDVTSLELMLSLGRRIGETRLVVIGTYRPEELDKAGARATMTVKDLLRELSRETDVKRMRLDRLTRDEVGEMLVSVFGKDGVDNDFVDFVFRHGEGNPYYTEEILRSIEVSGKLIRTDDGWRTVDLNAMDIPVTIKEAVLVRMASLPKRNREVLQHAAVIGKEWDIDILESMLRYSTDLEVVLLDLSKLDLVSEVAEGRYRFDHDVVRETAYEEMSEALRKLYHRKAGEAYEAKAGLHDGGGGVSLGGRLSIPDDLLFMLAEHFGRSKEMSKALKYNYLAGKTALGRNDTRGAEVFLARSREAARRLKDMPMMRRSLLDLAEVQVRNGEWDQALSNYNEAIGMMDPSEEAIRGRVIVKMASVHEWRNEWKTALDLVEQALDIFDRIGDPSGRASALAERGRLYRRIGNYDNALASLEESIELVKGKDGADERETLMKGLKERAAVLYYRGRSEEAISDYQKAMAIARRDGDDAMVASVLMNIGLVHYFLGDIDECIRHYEEAIDLAKRANAQRTLAFTYANLAEALVKEKRHDEAAGAIRKALEIFYRLEDRLSIAHTHMIFGILLTDKGELEEAIVHFNMALEMCLDIKESAILAQVYHFYGDLHVKKGDPAMARKLYKKAIALHTEAGRQERARRVKRSLEELEKSRKGRLGEIQVGRKRELIELIKDFREADLGSGRVVVVEGSTGTGKSKLVEQFLKVTSPQSSVRMVARCTPRETKVPYFPFIEALAAVFQKEIPTETLAGIREVVEDNPTEMLRLFPMLAAIPDIARVAAHATGRRSHLSSIQNGKDRLFDNITRLVLSFTRGRTVILILDDVHWADASSLGLVHYLARNSTGSRLIMILTYSPDVMSLDGRGHPLTDTLRLMNRERLTTTLVVGNLSEKETKEMTYMLLGGLVLPDEVLKLIFQETEGNPFFIEEVVLSLLEQGIIDPDDKKDPLKRPISEIEVPRTMSQVVERRLKALDEKEREVLRLAAVIGYRFDFETLRGLSGRTEDDLVVLLDGLMEKGIIIEEGSGEEVFRFPLEHFRRMLTEGLPPSESIKLHDKVARLLEAGDRPEERAFDLAVHHREAGNLLDAARWFLKAGEAARRLAAGEEAAHHLRTALDLVEQLPRSKEVLAIKARVQNAYGDVCYKIGNHEEAAQHFLYLLETAKEIGDDRDIGLAYLGIGRVRSNRGAFPQAKESFVKALDLFERAGDHENVVNARRAISIILWREGKFEEAVGELLEAKEAAKRLGDKGLMTALECGLGNVYRDMGDWDRSVSHFKKGIADLEEGGDLYELATSYNNIGATYRYMEQWDLAIQHFDRCIDLCQRIRFPNMMAYGLKNKGECLAKRGRAEDLDEADACVDKAYDIFEDMHHKPGTANIFMIRGIIQRFRRDWPAARKEFERAITAGRTSGVPDLLADVHYEYAVTLGESGAMDEAREQMATALDLFNRVGAEGRIERAREFLERTGSTAVDGGGDG